MCDGWRGSAPVSKSGGQSAPATLRLSPTYCANGSRLCDFHGCAFINILAETDRTSARERDIARRHKNELLELLIDQARKDGAARPTEAGRLALIVVEGAIVRAEMTGEGAKVAADAKRLLEGIVAT